MGHARSRSGSKIQSRVRSVLIVAGLALAFTAVPVTVGPDLASIDWQTALGNGKGGRGGDGPGGGPGGNRGQGGGHAKGQRVDGSKGQGYLYGQGRGHGHGQPAEYGSIDEFKAAVGSGKAFGLERRDERVEKAKERYASALSNGRKGAKEGGEFGVGPMAHRFTAEDTKALIDRGWKGPKTRTDGFRNHGERVRTMVELAKRLGYGAHVGALQANFGTPQENGISNLQTQLAEARTALEASPDDAELQAQVAALEAELEAAIAAAKPGKGPDNSWATADLDVNGDGVVDKRDVEALDAQATSASAADPAA